METTRVINPALLIEEVKKYPILYDIRNSHSSSNLEQKRRSWEMVAATLCGSRWHGYDDMEKESIAKEIQLKWKNLRDNFTRILRKEKEDELSGSTVKRKKYVYYDQLTFLTPFTSFRKMAPTEEIKIIKEECDLSEGKNAANIIYINETRDEESEEETGYQLTTTTPTGTSATSIPTPTLTPISNVPFQLIQIQPSTSGPSNSNAASEDLGFASGGRTAKVLEQLLKEQQEERKDDSMGNRKFLLSLQPFLQKLPDDLNLEVRLQIMSVLQNYSGGVEFNVNIY
ncbi:uncharacterized protein isoform X2 [Leptinotarsa decemlineata]|uniref:uncharacterized protein isoform X2 n=1 Tax=Leptinotarsa decemlineata TaxID=7539 RepID=UPI003D30A86E